jgi:hypothetical protein
VSLRFVRSIAANRDQTKHSARDRMLLGHDAIFLEPAPAAKPKAGGITVSGVAYNDGSV